MILGNFRLRSVDYFLQNFRNYEMINIDVYTLVRICVNLFYGLVIIY